MLQVAEWWAYYLACAFSRLGECKGLLFRKASGQQAEHLSIRGPLWKWRMTLTCSSLSITSQMCTSLRDLRRAVTSCYANILSQKSATLQWPLGRAIWLYLYLTGVCMLLRILGRQSLENGEWLVSSRFGVYLPLSRKPFVIFSNIMENAWWKWLNC